MPPPLVRQARSPASSSASRLTTAPAITSECPDIALVSEYSEAAAPQSSGRWSRPVAVVLSTIIGASPPPQPRPARPGPPPAAAGWSASRPTAPPARPFSSRSTAARSRRSTCDRFGAVRPQLVREHPGPVVAVGGQHDALPALGQREHQRHRGCLAGGEGHRLGVLQAAERLLQRFPARVAVPAVAPFPPRLSLATRRCWWAPGAGWRAGPRCARSPRGSAWPRQRRSRLMRVPGAGLRSSRINVTVHTVNILVRYRAQGGTAKEISASVEAGVRSGQLTPGRPAARRSASWPTSSASARPRSPPPTVTCAGGASPPARAGPARGSGTLPRSAAGAT